LIKKPEKFDNNHVFRMLAPEFSARKKRKAMAAEVVSTLLFERPCISQGRITIFDNTTKSPAPASRGIIVISGVHSDIFQCHGNGHRRGSILTLGIDPQGFIAFHACSGGNQLAEYNVLLATEKRVDLPFDGSFSEYAGSFLEGSGGEEGVDSQSSLCDA
jgi:hypothetical protein